MSATKTTPTTPTTPKREVPKAPAKETVVQKRNRLATAVRTAIGVIVDWELFVGATLNEARLTFKTDDTAAFLTWSEKACGLKKAMTYRYMQAATTVARVPSVKDKTTAITTLAWLARLTDEDTATVVSKIKKGATLDNVQAVAETVSEKQRTIAEKRATAEAADAEAVKVKQDKTEAKIEKQLDAYLPSLFVELETASVDDPAQAIRQAFLAGAQLIATGKVNKDGAMNYPVLKDWLKKEMPIRMGEDEQGSDEPSDQ